MIGTLFNVVAIMVGSLAGWLLKKNLSNKYKDTLMQALGLSASALGITWIVTHLSQSQSPILFIVSMVVGAYLGETIDLDGRIKWLTKSETQEMTAVDGLTTAILLFCVGTMSILGPIKSALTGDQTLLFTNATLDFVTSFVLASTFGIIIIVSAGVLLLWQGLIYLLASLIVGFVTPELMGEISIIGGILILSSGLNILKVAKIKTLNLLPTLIVPAIYYIPMVHDWIDSIIIRLGGLP